MAKTTSISTNAPPDTVGLADLARALIAHGWTAPPSYRQLYNRTLSGIIPAAKMRDGRWRILIADLPVIAARLGLERAPDGPRGQAPDSTNRAAAGAQNGETRQRAS